MPERGEVWLVDFGITQKVRPALVISVPYGERDRALVGVVPHTTATRGSQFEVPVPARFLAEGAFLVQGLQAVPPRYFVRKLGVLTQHSYTRLVRHSFIGSTSSKAVIDPAPDARPECPYSEASSRREKVFAAALPVSNTSAWLRLPSPIPAAQFVRQEKPAISNPRARA